MALVLLGGACDSSDASEALTVEQRRALVARDSAAGDAAAFASLPRPLHRVLRLEPFLTDQYVAATDGASCVIVEPPGAGGGLGLPSAGERRRVSMTLPDSTELLLNVLTDAGRVQMERVELVHAPRDGERLGYIWEGSSDQTLEVRWPPELGGGQETAPQPRGGPIPRALRALGRRVLALECVPESTLPAPDTSIAPDTASPLDAVADPPRS